MVNRVIGTVDQLSAGSQILTFPNKLIFWFVQNQDIAPLKVAFRGTRGLIMSSIVLAPATTRGGPGGYLDSVGFPYFDTEGVELSSLVTDAFFGSGYAYGQPVNSYAYPGSPIPP